MTKVKEPQVNQTGPSTEKTTVDNIGEAISVLVQAVHIAQAKGVYSFADSAKVGMALAFIEETSKAANNNSSTVNATESDKSKK